MHQREYYALPLAEAKHWWYLSLKDRLFFLFEDAIQKCNSNHPKVLDLGCGTGGNLEFLKSNFNQIYDWRGCEPNSWACKYSQMRGNHTEFSTIEGYKTEAKFDIVLLIDVIYHRDVNPNEALKKINKLMKPGGILIINSAAMPCLKRPHDNNVMGARRYMRLELIKACRNTEFELIDAFYWNSLLTPFLWLRIILSRLTSTLYKAEDGCADASDIQVSAPMLNKIMILILKFELYLNRQMIRLPWGSSVLYIGRKI